MTFGLMHTFIYIGLYIGLYIGWGISAGKRIVQAQVRRYPVAVASLTVFRFAIRLMKYYFVSDLGFSRQLWYWYYSPMLFIPLISVFISLSLGKPENYRLPKWTSLLYIPAIICLMLVVTNDFHQLIFSFPAGEIWTDKIMTMLLDTFLWWVRKSSVP